MRFQTPQFIEMEDKIFGPLTFKQFVYLIGGAGLGYLSYRLLPSFLGIIAALPIIALGVALAFYKINNKPFIFTLQAALKYATSQKLYIWQKPEPVLKTAGPQAEEKTEVFVPKLSASKLRDLAWSLDINEKINKDSE